MIAKAGHLAIIIPDFAQRRFSVSDLGFFEYLGNHQWRDWSGGEARKKIYMGVFA